MNKNIDVAMQDSFISGIPGLTSALPLVLFLSSSVILHSLGFFLSGCPCTRKDNSDSGNHIPVDKVALYVH
jgi:hypothetical protein